MKIYLLFLLFLCAFVQCQYKKRNETAEIKVVAYSQWMNGLPKFELPIVNNYIYYNLQIPRELSVVMESLGFSLIIVFVAVFLILFIIGYFFAQICLCGKQKYDKCGRLSGRLLSILILVSMIVSCSVGIFHFSRYYSSIWQGIDNVQNVIYDKRDLCVTVRDLHKQLDRNLVDLRVPQLIYDMENGTNKFNFYLSTYEAKNVRTFEQWGPVTMFVIIMLISIAGLMAVFFSKRFMFIIIAIFIGIMFIIILVAAVSSSVLSILLSDYCVGGVDNFTRLAINVMIQDKCTEEVFKYYLFCYWKDQSCNTLDAFALRVEYYILNITKMVNQNPNSPSAPTWRNHIRILREIAYRVNELDSCSSTQKLYLQTTQLFCIESTPSIIMFALVLELMVGIIFIFLLVVIRYNPEAPGKIQDDVDIEMEKRERRKKGLRPTKDLKKSKPNTPIQSCGNQCLTGFLSLIAGWGITLFVMFLIMSFGSNEVWVPRTVEYFKT